MNILINACNLAKGGGIQVTDSVCCKLNDYPQHHFVVVLNEAELNTKERIENDPNVTVCQYQFPAKDIKSLLTGRNTFLDQCVEEYAIECVLTIFGPMTWHPRVPHICGYAISHLVMPESPYFSKLKGMEKIKMHIWVRFNQWKFKRGTKRLYTENPLISERVAKMIKGSEVKTITNTYSQVFDEPDKQKQYPLPAFDGKTILIVTAAYPHKNLSLLGRLANVWNERYKNQHIRFVITITAEELGFLSEDNNVFFLPIGKVDISQCPSLYEQCDIVMQPSLLECFSAVYVEAMRTEKPLLVPDLVFVRGICAECATYYEADSATEAAEKLHIMLNNPAECEKKTKLGLEQLKIFDTADSRARKLINWCEEIAKK